MIVKIWQETIQNYDTTHDTKKYGRLHLKKDKWQEEDAQNVKVAMAFIEMN